MTAEYVVYWIETRRIADYFDEWDEERVNHEKHDDLGKALKFSESLRKRAKNGERIRHIAMSVENHDMVGELGVAGPPPGYDWRKRRP